MARAPRKRRPFAHGGMLASVHESLEDRCLMTAATVELLDDSDNGQPGVGHPAQLSPADSPLTLSQIHEATGVSFARSRHGLSGAGQTVVVIDSGIAWDHEALGGGLGTDYRVVGGWDFTEENDANPYDDGPAGFHGTHVAGIIASDDATHTGVAPNVDIVALRVFNDYGRSRMDWIESSLDWVIDNLDSFEHPVTTVNMSLGTDWNDVTLPHYDKLNDELRELESRGVFVSVAAGNSFDATNSGLNYPAVSEYVTPVASHSAGGQLSSFSQRNPLAIAAPGENITSTVPDYIEDFNGKTDDFYSATGTSMAAPYVAGASVLVREALQRASSGSVQVQDIRVEDIRAVLHSTATRTFDSATGQWYSHLNVGAAIESILPAEASSVEYVGSTLLVHGTHDADEIRVDQGGQVTVNGTAYSFSPGDVDEILIDGGAGHDRLRVENRVDNSRISFRADEVQIRHATQAIEANSIEDIRVLVHADNVTSQLIGTAGSDSTYIKPTHAWMENGDSLSYVRGAERVIAWANDADDLVTLYDGPGDDVLVSRSESTSMSGEGYRNFAIGFPQTVVRSDAGGTDRAEIAGTTGSDIVRVRPEDVSLQATNRFVYARGFSLVRVDGNGGADSARVNDSAGDDTVQLGINELTLETSTSTTRLTNIPTLEVFAGNGNDVAIVTGTEADEAFTAKPTHSWMTHGNSLSYVRGFDSVVLDGGGGSDVARIYDSVNNDVFQLGPTTSALRGSWFQYEVTGMARVHAFARYGTDTAELVDSQNADMLYATDKGVWMKSQGLTTIAQDFAKVIAESSNHLDRLIVESLSTTKLEGDNNWLVMDDDLELVARGFKR